MNQTISSIISISIIFAATTFGSAFVFFFRKSLSSKANAIILGFAGGVMMAATFFGLLMPSITESKMDDFYGDFSFIPPLAGFIIGGLILWLMDKFTPHLHRNNGDEEGIKTDKMSKNLKFFLAVTIHNIPEGLSVGIACGLALSNPSVESYMYSALALAIGIAIQNILEGAAVSIPMFSDGMKKGKAFLFGMGSGAIEPIAALLGLIIASISSAITPWLLSISAGAMIYVTLDDIIPESRKDGCEHYALWAFMIGFVIMMALELFL